MISVSSALAIGGVAMGVAAFTIAMSVTGGFLQQFREKVLGVNAHVLVLKYSIDFREYRDVMKKVRAVPGVTGVAPFVINPMMLTHDKHTATGVLLKGVDPELMPSVLDLPKHIVQGTLAGLRQPDAKPPERNGDPWRGDLENNDVAPTASAPSSGDPFLERIRRDVADEMSRRDAGARAASSAAAPVASARSQRSIRPSGVHSSSPSAPSSLPGNLTALTPDGGYRSRLPDDDALPEWLDPDPCAQGDGIARLPGIVVGRTLAKQLEVGLGDCVRVTSPQIGLSFGSSGRAPIAKQFRVIAIFEAGFDQYDSKLVYTDLYEAQAFYEFGDSVTGVEMKVDDIDKARKISIAIEKLLNNGIYHTMDWQELNHGLFTALVLQRFAMSGALSFIIVVAACTVIATLIMIVLEKKKEISVLKAMGSTNTAILRIFVYQGGIIGLIGTGLGLLVGWANCRFLLAYAFPLDPKVYFISRLPVAMGFFELALPAGFAMGICLLVTLLPAAYAARLRPADGLRAE